MNFKNELPSSKSQMPPDSSNITSGSTDINSVTNDLLLKYDKKFNELYNVKLKLNTSISNKEEIIIQLNDNNQQNDLIISLLQWLLSLFIVLIILYFFYKLKVFTLNSITLLFILLVLVYIFYGYNIYKKYSSNMFDKQLMSMKVTMNPYETEISNIIPREEGEIEKTCKKACPSGKINNKNEQQDSIHSDSLDDIGTLKTDPQLNVWKYGDLPEDLWTGEHRNKITNSPSKNITSEFETKFLPIFDQTFNNYDFNDITNPKARFGTTSPSMTYYKCDWMGSIQGGDDKFPFKSKLTYSSIPCEYKPNYIESGRYICSQNPNKISENNDFRKICDDVSTIYPEKKEKKNIYDNNNNPF
jgi:hypothetical protein